MNLQKLPAGGSTPSHTRPQVRAGITPRTRVYILSACLVLLSLAHYLTRLDIPLAHDIMDRLYYVPIALAAFWFGSRGSITVGVAALLLYVPHIIQFELFGHLHGHVAYGNKYAEAMIFPLFGLFVGRLIDVINERNLALEETYRELLASHESAQRSAKLALVGQIAAGFAHEIRNPLSGLRGAVEALGDLVPEDNEVGREFEKRAVAEVERISGLVAEFVAFGKPSPVERSPVRLDELVRGVASLLSSEARKQGVRIEVDKGKGDTEVMLDGNKMKQALLNLMLNGIQAMPEGGTLRASIEHSTGEVSISVQDEGPGIDVEDTEQIFAPFFTTKNQGAGLGLSLARQIAESHGGTLELEPAEGRGARFVMRLPKQGTGENKP